MKSTAKTISLCYQLLPVIGIVLGKVTEYCNDPPVFYRGETMKCLYTQDMFRRFCSANFVQELFCQNETDSVTKRVGTNDRPLPRCVSGWFDS